MKQKPICLYWTYLSNGTSHAASFHSQWVWILDFMCNLCEYSHLFTHKIRIQTRCEWKLAACDISLERSFQCLSNDISHAAIFYPKWVWILDFMCNLREYRHLASHKIRIQTRCEWKLAACDISLERSFQCLFNDISHAASFYP